MVDIYTHQLDKDIFDKIVAGKCNYLVCVNDKNVQTYKEGNLLTFVNAENNETVKAKVLGFLYFGSIKELVTTIGREKCGYSRGVNLDTLEDAYMTMFNTNKIDKFGFVAIEFQLANV